VKRGMRRRDVARDLARATVALLVAAAFIKTGASRLPSTASSVGSAVATATSEVVPTPSLPHSPDILLRHPPVFVYSEPMLAPLIVRAKRIIHHERGLFDRAPVGKEIRVSLTQYCLHGTTRRDNEVREGIVAADPRVFPLARYVDIFLGKHHLGKFLVDDTGKRVKGATLDIWTPSCEDARRFGRRWGTATLVARPH